MKGFWHIPALSILMSLLNITFNVYLFAILFFIWICYLFLTNRLGKYPVVISLICFLFFSHYIPSIHDFQPSTTHSDQNSQTIDGTIKSSINKSAKRVDFQVQLKDQNETYLVYYFIDSNEETSNKELQQEFKYGASCTLEGKFQHSLMGRNPGQFDYGDFLLKQGISGQFLVENKEDIVCHDHSSLSQSIYLLRASLMDQINKQLDSFTASWLKGLILGDDQMIEDDTLDVYRRWGLSHLLAISGLHVGLIIGLVYFMLVKFQMTTKEKAQWIIIYFLPFYALIAGGAPSVWRSSMMMLILFLLSKLKIKLSYTDILSIVFILFVLFDKYIVYQVGFQFSFLVTFGLLLSKKLLTTHQSHIYHLFLISFVSQMIIIPLQIVYFHTFHPLSILLNIIVVPYFTLFVIPFMFILLILLISPLSFLLTPMSAIFTLIHQFVLRAIHLLDQMAYYPYVIGEFPLYLVVIYYITFFFLMVLLERSKLRAAFSAGGILTLVLVFLVIRPYLSPTGTVTMLDIGQGDAFVIELPYRKGVIMIDAGANFSFKDFNASDQVYEHTIKPYFMSRGIQEVDAIFISHEDMDHMGSVPYLAKELNVGHIFISDLYEVSPEEAKVYDNNDVKVVRMAHRDAVYIGEHSFIAINPLDNKNDPNENSLVIFTELGGKSWLFTGDIGNN